MTLLCLCLLLNNQFQKINQEPIKGAAPCFIVSRPESKTVYTANYTSGSVSVFKTLDNGALLPIAQEINYSGSSIHKARQEASHAHNVVLTPDHTQLLVTDLGADKIYMHKIYADGLLDENLARFKSNLGAIQTEKPILTVKFP